MKIWYVIGTLIIYFLNVLSTFLVYRVITDINVYEEIFVSLILAVPSTCVVIFIILLIREIYLAILILLRILKKYKEREYEELVINESPV